MNKYPSQNTHNDFARQSGIGAERHIGWNRVDTGDSGDPRTAPAPVRDKTKVEKANDNLIAVTTHFAINADRLQAMADRVFGAEPQTANAKGDGHAIAPGIASITEEAIHDLAMEANRIEHLIGRLEQFV